MLKQLKGGYHKLFNKMAYEQMFRKAPSTLRQNAVSFNILFQMIKHLFSFAPPLTSEDDLLLPLENVKDRVTDGEQITYEVL